MKNIILCADDYGQNEAISQAIISLIQKNRLSATSCMTTSSHWLSQAKCLLPLKDQVDVGLHFNLTEGVPLSAELAESHGFMPLSTLLLRSYYRALNAHAIEAELNAQLDSFVAEMGCLPDFIDGHQHIHQFPMIRDVLFKVYEERLRNSGSYVRCIDTPGIFSLFLWRKCSFKRLVIQASGASAFKAALLRRQIPHNSSFSGIYDFALAESYPEQFPRFLRDIKANGIMMCHPGFASADLTDTIASARLKELHYLESELFLSDCFSAGIVLTRYKISG